MVKLGPQERALILRIRWLIGPPEGGEFLPASSPHRFNEVGIGVADEVRKGRRLSVLLPHEEERNEGRKQHDPSRELHPFEADKLTQPFAPHPVSHLVVVLRKDHEHMRRDIPRGISVPTVAIGGVLARIDEPLAKGLDEIPEAPEILVISRLVFRQERMEGMVEVVIPLGVQAVSPKFPRADNARIIEVALGDDVDLPIEPLRLLVYGRGQLQKRMGGEIQDAVDCIDPQGIDMKLRHPVQGILDEKTPNRIAVGSIEVDGRTPRGFVAIGEIRTEIPQVITFWTQVVIHHIQHDGYSPPVARVHQAL